MRLGVHITVGQGLIKAVNAAAALGCETIQMFSGNPRGWKNPAVDPIAGREFQAEATRLGIHPVVVHATYLINLASPSADVYEKSVQALADLMTRASALGAPYVVLHPGSHLGDGFEAGVQRIGSALRVVLQRSDPKVTLLLENVAGGGSTIGGRVSELVEVFAAAGEVRDRLGMCLDTCHAWSAGYDLRSPEGWAAIRAEIDGDLGSETLRVIHANDALGERGSHLDRHAHIGSGQLGRPCFAAMMRAGFGPDVACILETPKDSPEADADNLRLLEEFRDHSLR